MFEGLKSLLHLGGDGMFAKKPPPEPVVDAREPVTSTPSVQASYRRNLMALEALFRRLHHPDTPGEDKAIIVEQIGRRQRVLERSGLSVPVRLSECADALRSFRHAPRETR